jgi:hypothetical protein
MGGRPRSVLSPAAAVGLGLAALVITSCNGNGGQSSAGTSSLSAAAPTAGERLASSYPEISGGEWTRMDNLRDSEGRLQARQEHAAVNLNGFVYLIGGFVPLQPPPQPSEKNPEPFPFAGTGELLVYTPQGHTAIPPAQPGRWVSMPRDSWFPKQAMHHIIAVAHQGDAWTFGGHAGPFQPTNLVYRFTPKSAASAEGTWSQVRVSDGKPCGPGDECLTLPGARAAGAAVSLGSRIYVMGGVVPYAGSPDLANQSIRTTDGVIAVDTTRFPLKWETVASFNHSREHFNAVVVDNRIWVFHGRNETSTHMRGAESWSPGDAGWRHEQDAAMGTSANILAAVGRCVYSFGGEFIASNITGTLTNSQVFDIDSRSWKRLRTVVDSQPLDAGGADNKHGTYGVTIQENGVTKIMAAGGASTAWFAPMSKVHVFLPPKSCS